MAKVTGIGGVFFESGDPAALSAWYAEHLGVRLEDFGAAVLRWADDAGEDGGATAWCVTERGSGSFAPSASSFMINYRVDDLDALLAQLTAAGVERVRGPESHPNGTFAWILDPDGNKVELWQPMASPGPES